MGPRRTSAPGERPRRRFGRVRELPSGRFQAGYITPDGTTCRADTTFPSRAAAERWLSVVETDLWRGEWVDPRRPQETVGEWASRWFGEGHSWKPKTRADYEMLLRTRVLPRWGSIPIDEVAREDVRTWVAELIATEASASIVRRSVGTLSRVVARAIDAGAIAANPCVRIKLPRLPQTERHFLTPMQVEALANAIQHPVVRPAGHGASAHWRTEFPEYGLLVRFAAYTGLRAAEIAGLRVDRLDLVGAKVRVVETLSEVGSTLHTVATKNYQQRSVPLPKTLSAVFARHVEAMPKKAYVFQAPNGGPLRWGNFYNRHFLPAVAQSGMPPGLHFHDLRHTYAGFLIAEGAHPRALMERLGHSTINVTLGTYGHLLPSLERDLTDRLDATLAASITKT